MHAAVSGESRNYVADILTLQAYISDQIKIYLTDTLVYETSIFMLNLETHLFALAHKKIVFYDAIYIFRGTIINFLVLSLVLLHMLTHTFEGSFKCEVCSTLFGYKEHLCTHTGEGR